MYIDNNVHSCSASPSFNPVSAGTVFVHQNLTSVDVMQILMNKDCPRTERIKIFLMSVDPYRYSNEAARASRDIYDNLKLRKTLWFQWFMQKYFSVVSRQGLNWKWARTVDYLMRRARRFSGNCRIAVQTGLFVKITIKIEFVLKKKQIIQNIHVLF